MGLVQPSHQTDLPSSRIEKEVSNNSEDKMPSPTGTRTLDSNSRLSSSSIPRPKTQPEPALISPGHRSIMLKYSISRDTLESLKKLSEFPPLNIVLQAVCTASELTSFPMKPAERHLFAEINRHPLIDWPIKESISKPWHKAFLHVQLTLTGAEYPAKLSGKGIKELMREKPRIFKVLRCVLCAAVELMSLSHDGVGVKNALMLLRCIAAGS
jgi:hypothetical protein